MRAVCDDAATLQYMLDFEAALARAEAAVGVIPASAVGSIANACKAEGFDIPALAEAATRSGNLAIPLVKALTAAVAKADPELATGFANGVGWNPAEAGSGWKFFRLQPVRIQSYRGYDELTGRDVMRDSQWLA